VFEIVNKSRTYKCHTSVSSHFLNFRES